MGELKRRLLTSLLGIVFLVIFVPLSTVSFFRPIFVMAIAAVSALGIWEYYQLAKVKGHFPHARIGIVFTILYIFSSYLNIYFDYLGLLPYCVLALASFCFFLSQFREVENSIANLASSVFGLAYIAIPMSGMIYVIYQYPQDGRWWFAYLVIVTKMSDIGGYAIGKIMGKHKLASRLSPKKTVEGALGGIVFSIISSVAIYFVAKTREAMPIHLTLVESIWLAIVLSLFAQIGDIAESLLKRDAGVKDSSSRLPGMGGVLDLLDALLFTTPVLLLFNKYLRI